MLIAEFAEIVIVQLRPLFSSKMSANKTPSNPVADHAATIQTTIRRVHDQVYNFELTAKKIWEQNKELKAELTIAQDTVESQEEEIRSMKVDLEAYRVLCEKIQSKYPGLIMGIDNEQQVRSNYPSSMLCLDAYTQTISENIATTIAENLLEPLALDWAEDQDESDRVSVQRKMTVDFIEENVPKKDLAVAIPSRVPKPSGSRKLGCWNCFSAEHYYPACPHPFDRRFCFHCGLDGFKTYECPNCQDEPKN